MNIVVMIIDLFIFLLLVYLIVFREYFLAKKEFNCLRCGHCCKLCVKLSQTDKQRLKEYGISDFLESDNLHLKKINGNCKFLKLENGIASCIIQDIKPDLCRNFPNKKLFFKRADTRCRFYSQKLF